MYPRIAAWRLSFLLLLYRPKIAYSLKVRKSWCFKSKKCFYVSLTWHICFLEDCRSRSCLPNCHTLGQRGFFTGGWDYYPTAYGKVHKARATASMLGDRAVLHLGSAARNARDARFRGRFPASLAALARCTAPLPTVARYCGSCGTSVPVPAIAPSSSSSAASAVWVLWCYLRRY